MKGKIFRDIDKNYLERILSLHFDPESGTPFYINKAKEQDLNTENISINEVDRYFTLTNNSLKEEFDNTLRKGTYKQITPSSLVENNGVEMIGESGGTTGAGKRAAFSKEEFNRHIEKANKVLNYANFPKNKDWLVILPPYPPQGIGKFGPDLAKIMGGEAFGIDLDPRILKKYGKVMSAGNEFEKQSASWALNHYMEHIKDQIKDVIESENDIKNIFTTPILLEKFPEWFKDNKNVLDEIEGIFYGGTRMYRDTYKLFREDIFPDRPIIGIYGSGHLGGLAYQLPLEDSYEIIYIPFKELFDINIVDENNNQVDYGEKGRVLISKYSNSLLMQRYPDEDEGTLVEPPEEYKELGVTWPCIKDITPNPMRAKKEVGGVYWCLKVR